MNSTFNVGVVGYRGSGKTTLCYRLMGIDPPQKPNGTTSLDYMTCNWDNKHTILAWDFTPGVSPHTQEHINDMQCIVLCCDGRNNRSSVSALQFLSTCTPPVVVALTRMTPLTWCIPLFFADIGRLAKSPPVLPCYNSADALIAHITERFLKHSRILVAQL